MRVLLYDSWSVLFGKISNFLGHDDSLSIDFVHNDRLVKKYSGKKIKQRYAQSFDCNGINRYHDLADFHYDVNTMINQLKPDCVLFLSIHNLDQRTIIYALNKNFPELPIYLLMHGVIGNGEIVGRTSLVSRILSYSSRFGYYYAMFWMFFKALKIRDVGEFVREFVIFHISPNRYKNFPIIKSSVKIDYLFYCNDSDLDYYRGYTDLHDLMGLKVFSLDYLEYALTTLNLHENIEQQLNVVVFLDQGYEDLGVDKNSYFRLLFDIKKELEAHGFKLLVKEHPRLKSVLLESQEYERCMHESMQDVVSRYSRFITINSTASMLPLSLGHSVLFLSDKLCVSNSISTLEYQSSMEFKQLRDIGSWLNFSAKSRLNNYTNAMQFLEKIKHG